MLTEMEQIMWTLKTKANLVLGVTGLVPLLTSLVDRPSKGEVTVNSLFSSFSQFAC